MDQNSLIEVIENILLTPSSDFYISTILHDPGGQALDPRTLDSVDLGQFDVEGIAIGIVLNQFTVKGLSNTQVQFDAEGNPEITVDGDTVTFHAKLPNTQDGYQRPPDVPPQVQANGQLDITIAGAQMPPGTIDLTIASVDDFTGVFSATESQSGNLDTLEVTFSALSVNPALTGNNMVVTVSLETVFVATINQVLNFPDNLARLVAQVNAKLASPDLLASLSKGATAQARKALATH